MKGSPEGKTDVQRLRVIAAECRAAVRRCKAMVHGDFCGLLLVEADRHAALLDGSGFRPAFDVTIHWSGKDSSPKHGVMNLLGTILSPSGRNNMILRVPVNRPTGRRGAGLIRKEIVDIRVAKDSRCRELGVEAAGNGEPTPYEYAFATSPIDPSLGLFMAPTGLVDTRKDAEAAFALVSDALLSMADYMDFLVGTPESVRRKGILTLNTNAYHVMELLWKRRATHPDRAVPVKSTVLNDERSIRQVPTRNTKWTYAKAAEDGLRRLVIAGYAVGRTGKGSWLTAAGVAEARQRFSREFMS